MKEEVNIEVFNQDVEKLGGYEYALGEKLSTRIVSERNSKAIHSLADFKGKRVIDVGCGDGVYTAELEALKPSYVLGIDAADAAIQLAKKKLQGNPLFEFETRSIYEMEPYHNKFDIAVVRWMIHHLEDPGKAIQEVVRCAPIVIVADPNGYNPVLKLLEKYSDYHIRHGEKSFTASQFKKWFKDANAPIVKDMYVNTVPMFCNDNIAKTLDFIAPLAERLPLVKHLGCGQYVFRADRLQK